MTLWRSPRAKSAASGRSRGVCGLTDPSTPARQGRASGRDDVEASVQNRSLDYLRDDLRASGRDDIEAMALSGPSRSALVVETLAVLLATSTAIATLRWSGLTAWWTTPAILIAAGIVPFLARRQSPPAILRVETFGRDLGLTVCTSLAILPLTYLAIGLLTRLGIAMPSAQARPSNYAVWVLYQFLYAAVAEEVFFRGYILKTLLEAVGGHPDRSDAKHHEVEGSIKTDPSTPPSAILGAKGLIRAKGWFGMTAYLPTFLPSYLLRFLRSFHRPPSDRQTVRPWRLCRLPSHRLNAAIVLSAACFAMAHAVLQGQAAGLLTFLPGLVLGWLFVRTRTLVAPILFHGLANVFWVFVVR